MEEKILDAMKTLGLGLVFSFSSTDLKQAHYKKAMECHPDLGGSNDKMNKVNEAAQTLKKFLNERDSAIGLKEPFADSLTKEPGVVYVTCPTCNGDRVVPVVSYGYAPCPKCSYLHEHLPRNLSLSELWDEKYFASRYDYRRIYFTFGFWYRSYYEKVPCPACKGTGKFELKSKRKVKCLRCNGRSWLLRVCRTCFGTGEIQGQKKIDMVRCSPCRGIGKVKHIQENPVIPVGTILITGEKLSQKERKRRGLV